MKYSLLILLLFCCNQSVFSNVIVAGPSDFRTYLPDLEAGDTMYLIPGNYTQSLRIIALNGSIQQPILISGQPGSAKPVFIGNACCNTISITQSSFLHVKDIVCDGQDIAGIDALKAEGTTGNWTHDIEIEGLEIYNYGGDQQNVGISTKCPSWNWWIHHNVVDAAGTGFYLGNSDGNQPFVGGLIEYNLIKNTVGYSGQIKHQNNNTRDLTLGMPENSSTVIRYNVFSKESNASSGDLARPNLLVGNFPASGAGSNDFYDIYGNFFFQNPVEALFQGTGNIGFHNNILFNDAGGWGVSIQTHNGFQPREVDVFCNTVLVDGNSGVSISGVNSAYAQKIWANAVFATPAISGGQSSQNLTSAFNQAATYLTSLNLPLAMLDLTPKNGQLNIPGIDFGSFNKYQHGGFDFDGFLRDGNRAGAYTSEGRIWPLQLNVRDQIDLQDVSTDTEIFLDQTSINIYPCPSDQFIQIEGLLSNFQMMILDSSGQNYQTLNSNSNVINIDIQKLPAGIFFISIYNKTNNNLSMVKMIKQ